MRCLVRNLLVSLCVAAFLPAIAIAVESYKFERMFPVLQQPWYFVGPSGLAIDSKGFVYVADSTGQQIFKFTSEGFFINKFGTFGRKKEEFYQPKKIAIDKDDNIYVIDTVNYRIQKFNSDGKFISFFGEADVKEPYGIGIDNQNGYIYVANVSYNESTVKKFRTDGTFIQNLGQQGTGEREFSAPTGIGIDSNGNVYITDNQNHCVQKFDKDGVYSGRWGGVKGNAPGQFNAPEGVWLDNQNNVYVADTMNHRIQIFYPDMKLKTILGNKTDISKHQEIIGKNVMVIPILLEVFQMKEMSTEEATYSMLQEEKDGSFNEPFDIKIDEKGFIYVADCANQRIQKFTPDYQFVSKWSSTSEQKGMFRLPIGMAMDDSFIYVVDGRNHRIQKFRKKDGVVQAAWGKQGIGEGEFELPVSIALDKQGFLYVTDFFNHRVQKFTTNGVFVSQWGGEGSEDGKFRCPFGIAIDKNNDIYVTDLLNFRIQKFRSDGTPDISGKIAPIIDIGYILNNSYLMENIYNILTLNCGDDLICQIQCISDPACIIKSVFQYLGANSTKELLKTLKWDKYIGFIGIAVDSQANIYTTNSMNSSFQKFGADGTFSELKRRPVTDGTDNFDQYGPTLITIAPDEFIYVSDVGNSRIDQFKPDGTFIQSLFQFGSDVGKIRAPMGISVDTDGKIYVADSGNNRIQIFRKGLDTDKKMKAIIIAGGENDSNRNKIWDATQMNANFAYRALMYQGFSKDSIRYLSSNTELDLDNDGIPEVKAASTNANLQTAITDWAKDADDLVVYFVDHGGIGTLRMNASETLSASELDSWLDTAQQTIPGTVTFVYDACYSGSFLPAMKPPDGKKRIVVSSASEKEEAAFTTDGSTAFSSYFWTHIFNGATVGTAFNFSRKAMGYLTTSQNALSDDNGDGISDSKDGSLAAITYIGNGTAIYANAPKIGSVSPEQTIHLEQTTSADIAAYTVTSPDHNNIVHVWAVIRPPDYQPTAGNPVTDLPSVDLSLISGGAYKVTYNEFKTPGTYSILVYARDDRGYTSEPSQAVVIVESPLRHKAIIVAGIQPDDKWRAAVEKSVQLSYNALKFQKYSDDDIFLMSPVSIAEVSKMPTQPTLENLRNAMSALTGDNTQDLVLYMIGNGADGAFGINPSETLLPADLNTWLNDLQTRITGKVVVIYDACRAESFAQNLRWDSGKTKRIVIASTRKDQSAHFMTEGGVSFSGYFWNKIWDGATVWDAFYTGKEAFNILNAPISCKPQNPYLDDDGNGITTKDDRTVAESSVIGAGIRPGDSPPTINSTDMVLIGKTSGIIRAGVTGSGNIGRVWAAIDVCTLPASPDTPITELSEKTELVYNSVSGLYEGKYDNYSDKCQIFIYAADAKGNISLPVLVKTISSPSTPSVVSIKCSPAAGEFTVTFSEPVSGIDVNDFVLVKDGTDGTIASISASSGKTVNVTVNSITGSGTLGLNLADNDSIVSTVGIPLGGTGIGNGNFTGDVCTIDKIAPIITSITSSTPDGNYCPGNIISVTVNFSKAATLSGGNLIVNLDSGGQAVIPPFGPAASVSGNYTVEKDQKSADLDSISLNLTGGAVLKDSAGNVMTDFSIPQSLKDSKAIVIRTDCQPPPVTVTLNSVSNTPPYTAAGTAVGDGISERGFFWWIPPGPETHWGGSESGLLPEGSYGAGNFSLNLTALKPGTKYHAKAYIKVGDQIVTSDETVFTTAAGKSAPTVITTSCKLNADGTVSASGEITDIGSSPVNVYGFVYAKHPNPLNTDSALALSDQAPVYQGISFAGTIRNLQPGIYYLRSYAHNENPDSDAVQTASLGYGQDCTFTVDCTPETCVAGDVNRDGKVDLNDAVPVLKILAGIPVHDINLLADVNGDGRIGKEELAFILQKAAGLR